MNIPKSKNLGLFTGSEIPVQIVIVIKKALRAINFEYFDKSIDIGTPISYTGKAAPWFLKEWNQGAVRSFQLKAAIKHEPSSGP